MKVEDLVNKYHYKPLPKELSKAVRRHYWLQLPPEIRVDGDLNCKVYDKEYHFISHGYNRVVIGDYGAFVEISLDQMNLDDLQVAKGQEYRFLPQYQNVKYHWYCLKNNPDIKIYFQKHTVEYADYCIDKFYIAPDDLIIVKKETTE